MIKRQCILILIIAQCLIAISQGDRYGILPQLKLNFSIANNWKCYSSLESRQIFMHNNGTGPSEFNYLYERTDLSIVLKKRGLGLSYGFGYLFRVKEGEIVHRYIQQIAWVNDISSFKLGNRLRADQTKTRFSKMRYRIRYRFTFEIPLSGHSVDKNELYLKFNNEYLGIYEDSNIGIEIRCLGALGFNIFSHNKLEIGTDYRVSDFSDDARLRQLWLTMAWYISL